MRSGNIFLKTFFLFSATILTCFLGYGATHTSKNNYTGNWESSATWQAGTGNLSNNDIVNIYGFVKRNSNLVLNNGIDIHVYDTLFIFGDLDIRQNGYLNIHAGGMVVVFGNVIAFQNVAIDLSSYFVVVGNFTAENNADITAPSDSTVLYVTGSTSCATNATCVADSLVGNEEDLLDNPVLGDLVTAYTMVILPSSPILCPGGAVVLSIRSDGSNYQWYRNGISISGATNYTYSATQTGDYDVSFSIGATNYPRTGTPNPVAVAAGSTVSINSIGSNIPVQVGATVNLSLDRSTSSPASISGQQWSGPDSYSSIVEDPSFTASATTNTGYYKVTVTSDQGCTQKDSTYVIVFDCSTFNGGTIGYNQTICAGSNTDEVTNISLPSPGSGFTYSWYSSANSSDPASGTWTVVTDSLRQALFPGILANTTYIYRLAENSSGCIDSSNVVIKTVNPLPTVTASAIPDTICFGDYSDLNAIGGVSYSWIPAANLDNASAQNPRYTPIANPTSPIEILTTFTVTATDINNCINTETVDVLLIRNPETGPHYHIEDVW